MSNKTLFIAPLGARNKKESTFKEIISLCPEGDYSSVLYLSPNRFVLGETERDFFSYMKRNLKRSAYIPFQSFTIKELASSLHEIFGNETRISDLTRSIILCEMLGGEKIGYADLLSGLLNKIRHYIPDRDLSETKEAIREQIFEEKAAERAVQAIETLVQYEEKIKEKGLIDPEDILKNSITYINAEHRTQSTEYKQRIKDLHLNPRTLESPNPFSYSTLIVDGFFDPTPLELELIKTVTEKAEKTIILVEEEAGFYRYLKKNAGEMVIKRLPGSTRRETSGYFSYPSMEDEINGIARQVKRLILEGTRPWEIAVSFPILSKYLPMLRRVFHKHGIPIGIAEYDLSNRRPFTTIEDMISCLENDYPGHNFLSFLTSPDLASIPRIVREEAVAYSYKAGIVKGRESWLSIRDILLNSPEEKRPAEETARIDEFQKEIENITKMFEDIKDQKNLSAFIDAFESALERLGLFDSLAESIDGLADKIRSRFSELRHFAEAYGADEKGRFSGIEKNSFYIRRIFKDIKGYDRSRDSVKVAPFELAAGLEVKALFFGGMTEGDFPSKPAIDPILPERIKKDLGMPYLEYYLDRQKRYFRRLLNLSIFDPHFSCPSAEGDKPFLPSPLLDWEGKISPPAINIHTEEEVMINNPTLRRSEIKSNIFPEGPPAFDKETLKAFGKSRVMSGGFINVTDIDSFRKCPLRFYIERVLKLEADRPPRFEVESRLWGILAHRTMEHLFREGDITLENMEKRLSQGLRKSLRQFPIGDFWERVAGEIFRRLIPMIKAQEADLQMQGYSPYMVEKGIKTEMDGLHLKGKIDRVDFKKQDSGVEGSRDEDKEIQNTEQRAQTEKASIISTVILLDYKTGMTDRDSLQLPLYAAMWSNDRAEEVEKTGVYSLKNGKIDWFPKRKSMEEYIQDAVETADKIIRDMKRGKFSAKPFKAQECRYCYHSPLCEGTK